MNELENTLEDLRVLIANCHSIAEISPNALKREVAEDVRLALKLIEVEILDLLQRQGSGSLRNSEERVAAIAKISAQFKSAKDYLESRIVLQTHDQIPTA